MLSSSAKMYSIFFIVLVIIFSIYYSLYLPIYEGLGETTTDLATDTRKINITLGTNVSSNDASQTRSTDDQLNNPKTVMITSDSLISKNAHVVSEIAETKTILQTEIKTILEKLITEHNDTLARAKATYKEYLIYKRLINALKLKNEKNKKNIDDMTTQAQEYSEGFQNKNETDKKAAGSNSFFFLNNHPEQDIDITTATESFTSDNSAEIHAEPGLLYNAYSGIFYGDEKFFSKKKKPFKSGYVNNLTNLNVATEGAFSPSINNQTSNLTVEWVGYFKPDVNGEHTFYIKTSNIVHIWLGELSDHITTNTAQLAKNNTGDSEIVNFKRALKSGNYYPIRIRFGGVGPNQDFHMHWCTSKGCSEANHYFHNSLKNKSSITTKTHIKEPIFLLTGDNTNGILPSTDYYGNCQIKSVAEVDPNRGKVTMVYDNARGYVFSFNGLQNDKLTPLYNRPGGQCMLQIDGLKTGPSFTRSAWAIYYEKGCSSLFSSQYMLIRFDGIPGHSIYANYVNAFLGVSADPQISSPRVWHHYLVTYNATSKIMCFFIDGKLIENATIPGSWSPDTTKHTIGGYQGYGQQGCCWAGQINDIYQYDYALTADQVHEKYEIEKKLYEKSNEGKSNNLEPFIGVYNKSTSLYDQNSAIGLYKSAPGLWM